MGKINKSDSWVDPAVHVIVSALSIWGCLPMTVPAVLIPVLVRKQRGVVNRGRIITAFLLSVGTAESPLILPELFCLKLSHLQAN